MTDYRTIDGTNNNQNFNATGTDMTRVGDAHFVDGISIPIETVNPRTVSNNVVGEGDANVPNSDGLSAFMVSGVVRPQPCLPPRRRRTAVARRSDPWDDARRSWRARRAGRLAD